MLYLQPQKNGSLSHHLFRSNLYPQWKYFSTNFNIAS